MTRSGRPASQPQQDRRPWDPRDRAAATALQRDFPRWLIMYGPYSRAFYAYPRFDGPPGLILNDPLPRGLAAAMRGAELAASGPPPARRPAGGLRGSG